MSCSFSVDTLFFRIIWDLDWRWAPPERMCVYFCWSLSTQGHLQRNSPLIRFIQTTLVVRTWTTNHVKVAYEFSAQHQGQYRLLILYPYTEEALLVSWLHPGSSWQILQRAQATGFQSCSLIPYFRQLPGRELQVIKLCKISAAKASFGPHSPSRIPSFTLFRVDKYLTFIPA